jgi:23S rRNA (guanosine2251-2'-O)-methyltransferase
MNSTIVLEGCIAVRAALLAQSRVIHTLYIRSDRCDGESIELERLARERGVRLRRAPAGAIDSYASGKTHGGVVALAGPRRFRRLEQIVERSTHPFIAMLDGIEDPYNFGYSIRSLYAAGADGLVVRPRNWMDAAGVVARASAGASELIPTAVAESAAEAAALLRSRGLLVACTGQEGAVSIYQTNLAVPLFVLIGGEKRGITRSFREQADLVLHIPYCGAFQQSLGTASAAAILSFEVMRQRSAGLAA